MDPDSGIASILRMMTEQTSRGRQAQVPLQDPGLQGQPRMAPPDPEALSDFEQYGAHIPRGGGPDEFIARLLEQQFGR
jgi:hypothetical protein